MQKQKAVQETPGRLFLYGANAIKKPSEKLFRRASYYIAKDYSAGKDEMLITLPCERSS